MHCTNMGFAIGGCYTFYELRLRLGAYGDGEEVMELLNAGISNYCASELMWWSLFVVLTCFSVGQAVQLIQAVGSSESKNSKQDVLGKW